ncbi:MAG: repeat protein [Planctomycetaceae bacterium]|nr:repeat protein [Planctomycetaceae bacterium]
MPLAQAGCGRQTAPSGLTEPKKVTELAAPPPLVTLPISPAHAPAEREPRADDWFAEISRQAGVDFTYQNGRDGLKFTLLESIGGGAALFDFNNDNLPDLFITGGGSIQGSPVVVGGLPNALYRNSGESTFTDISRLAGVSGSLNYTVGCSVCDYNCDGQPDLFVTGYPQCQLYCNQGDGTFLKVTESAGLNFSGLRVASTWGDFDGDGLPELFVTGYVRFDLRENRNCGEDLRGIRDICGIWQYPPAPDQLYGNRGDGTFGELTKTAGLRADGKGLGVVAADFNDDGSLDLYVGNDFTPNFLYLGDGHGQFQEQGLISGAALDANGAPQGSMGVDFSDYDGDGRGDFFVTNYQLEDNTLYHNLGAGSFAVAMAQTRLQDVCRPYVGFGTGWVDWNSDGWLDLFVLNGHVMYHTGQSPYEQPQFLFRNRDGLRFENLSEQGGPYFSIPHVARGGAVGDLNNDGAPDLVIVHQNHPVSVLQNQLLPTNWVSVCLRGTRSDPFAVGAVVTARFAGRILTRHVRSGAGYLSHFDRRILLPVDNDGAMECSVRWLNGRRETFRNLQPRQTNQLIEGRGEMLSTAHGDN